MDRGRADPWRRIRGEEPRETDDMYALGMTLIEAATGLIPLALDHDPELPRVRGLETVRLLYGEWPDGVVRAAIDLTSTGTAVAQRAFEWLAEGRERTYVATTRPALIEDLTRGLLDVVCAQVNDLLGEESAPETSVRYNPSIFTGTAGIGLGCYATSTGPASATVSPGSSPGRRRLGRRPSGRSPPSSITLAASATSRDGQVASGIGSRRSVWCVPCCWQRPGRDPRLLAAPARRWWRPNPRLALSRSHTDGKGAARERFGQLAG
ncbi:MAG TPA: hypothetical protein VI076_09365, partial [Actinopolymorphaceae bacterium]